MAVKSSIQLEITQSKNLIFDVLVDGSNAVLSSCRSYTPIEGC